MKSKDFSFGTKVENVDELEKNHLKSQTRKVNEYVSTRKTES